MRGAWWALRWPCGCWEFHLGACVGGAGPGRRCCPLRCLSGVAYRRCSGAAFVLGVNPGGQSGSDPRALQT